MATYGIHRHRCASCGREWACTDLDCHQGDLCLQCDDEQMASYVQAREHDGDTFPSMDYRCRDSRQHTFTF